MTNRWRWTIPYMVTLWIACAFLISLDALISHQAVRADIDEKSHLGFLSAERKEDGSWGTRGSRWITRNLIDGRPIPVCSKDYPGATREAINRWNKALRIEAFTMMDDAEACIQGPPDGGWMPEKGTSGVTISRGRWLNPEGEWDNGVPPGKWTNQRYWMPVLEVTCGAWGGCAGFEVRGYANEDSAASDPWMSYHGRGIVVMNPWNYPYDIDKRPLTNIRRDIAHELGHILALADYFCHFPGAEPDVSDHPDKIEPPTRTLMNSFAGRTRTVTVQGTPTELSCNALRDVPAPRDLQDYHTAYLPATVSIDTDKVTVSGRSVTLTWDQSDVYVESHFEIQRASGSSGDDWATVERNVLANTTRFTLVDQPSGEWRYQIVAATLALCPKEDTEEHCLDDSPREHAYGDPSNVVSVTVPPSPVAPTGLTVSDVTSNSATLHWNEVTGASGYEVQLDGEDIWTALDENARSYTFSRRLTSRKAHILGVQATRDGLHSTFATLTLLKPPSSIDRETTTHNSVTYKWSDGNPAGSATGAEVKIGGSGTERDADSTTTHTFGNLTAGKWYTFYFRLKNDQGPSAWRTESFRAPLGPTRPTSPSGLACLSSRMVDTFVTWDSDCVTTTWKASDLLSALRRAGTDICAVGVWQVVEGGEWRLMRYGLVDGHVIPGSVDTPIKPGDSLWLNDCDLGSGSNGVSGASGLEPPSCPDVVKPETGPAVFDAGAGPCATVRGGGALQISRGEYTLNLTLPTDRDWWATAPLSYTGSSAGAFLFLDLSTGGWLALYPPNGAELARHAPADAEGLPALLDAIVASAAASPSE